MKISTVPEILAEIAAGRMVVVVDDEDRENEGDLLMAADAVTPEAINFMAKYGRGLICLTLTGERCDALKLPLMVSANGSGHGTNFTVSIEAAQGVSTGISAADRAATVLAAVGAKAMPEDIVQPGHIFPLRAMQGGVLSRAGHTEAGCDLARMAGKSPAAVICEILNEDGTMARLPDLLPFAEKHGLLVGTIEDLIQYRAAHESLLEVLNDALLETAHGVLRCVSFRDTPTGQVHMALVKGEITAQVETLVRVHEPLSTLDWLEASQTGQAAGQHTWPLPIALQTIAAADAGVLVLLNCAQNAADLVARVSPPQAVVGKVGKKPADLRTYGVGAQILKHVGVGKMRLMAKARKMPSMGGFDLEVTGYYG